MHAVSPRAKLLKRVSLATFLFAAGMFRLWPHYNPQAEFPKHPEAIHLARSLAFGHQFANPFRLIATGPSAYLSPAFPSFLALLIRIFGTGARADFVFRLCAAAATAAELALLPILTELMEIGLTTGILACAIGLLPPILTFPDWEMSYAGLLAVIITILCWIVLRGREAKLLTYVSLGIATGSILLTSASVLPVLAVWFAYAVWKFRAGVFRQGRWSIVLIVIAMLTPWTVRNFLIFHRFIPFRTALGLALEASNNDCALAGVRQSEASGCFQQHSPNHNLAEALQARDMGEAEYNSAKLHETVDWVREHPRRFSSLTAQRTYAFWFPHEANSLWEELTLPDTRRRERLTIYLATVLSLPGLLLLLRPRREAGLVLASWLIFFPPIYYIALFEDRYRYPILWVTFVCAAFTICRAAEHFYSRWQRSRSG